MSAFLEIWNLFLLEPMVNSLIVLYKLLFSNFGLAILIFTLLVRLITLPLFIRQMRTTKAMSQLQPKLQEINKKFKDPQRRQQETMKLYKEHKMSPLGCLGPTLIQFPIWIALYQAVMQALAVAPEGLLGVSERLYPWSLIHEALPLNSGFLWMNLGRPDPYPIMAILVGGSMWAQQKMMTFPSADPRQSSMNTMMLWLMPIMFGFWTFYFPSGLSLYWVVSNLVGIAIQYKVSGWGSLTLPSRHPAPPQPAAPTLDAPQPPPPSQPAVINPAPRQVEKVVAHGRRYRGKRQVRRRSHRARHGPPGPGPQPGPNRGPESR